MMSRDELREAAALAAFPAALHACDLNAISAGSRLARRCAADIAADLADDLVYRLRGAAIGDLCPRLANCVGRLEDPGRLDDWLRCGACGHEAKRGTTHTRTPAEVDNSTAAPANQCCLACGTTPDIKQFPTGRWYIDVRGCDGLDFATAEEAVAAWNKRVEQWGVAEDLICREPDLAQAIAERTELRGMLRRIVDLDTSMLDSAAAIDTMKMIARDALRGPVENEIHAL